MTDQGFWSWKPLGCGGSEGGSQHGIPVPLLSLERQILHRGGGASGSRAPGVTRRGASCASDFYGYPSKGRWFGPMEGCCVAGRCTGWHVCLDATGLGESPSWEPGVPQVVRAPRQAAFTTTKVPRFGGTTSWEQYRQVFDAIVHSNGWDNDTAALQLFSHLEGVALNVALLVPLSRRLSRRCLINTLSAHYGFPSGSVGGLPKTVWEDN